MDKFTIGNKLYVYGRIFVINTTKNHRIKLQARTIKKDILFIDNGRYEIVLCDLFYKKLYFILYLKMLFRCDFQYKFNSTNK